MFQNVSYNCFECYKSFGCFTIYTMFTVYIPCVTIYTMCYYLYHVLLFIPCVTIYTVCYCFQYQLSESTKNISQGKIISLDIDLTSENELVVFLLQRVEGQTVLMKHVQKLNTKDNNNGRRRREADLTPSKLSPLAQVNNGGHMYGKIQGTQGDHATTVVISTVKYRKLRGTMQ